MRSGSKISYKKPPEIETGSGKINLLIVSPLDADYTTLQQILSPNQWVLSRAKDLRSALTQLRTVRGRFPLVLCECDLSPDTWKELLEDAPLLIVASRFADERLWAEALNVGAYDVLAKPFEPEEVKRVLTSAWVRTPGGALAPQLDRHQTTVAAIA